VGWHALFCLFFCLFPQVLKGVGGGGPADVGAYPALAAARRAPADGGGRGRGLAGDCDHNCEKRVVKSECSSAIACPFLKTTKQLERSEQLSKI
jgi:hypothetical protein